MTIRVPYIAEKDIEDDATALLADYAQARGTIIVPPIPIEDIVEKHLKLTLDFNDTHRLFGVPRSGTDPDILGAVFFDERRIVIDESLDPDQYPAKEGRYRFTLAHEGGGHWRLHRTHFTMNRGLAPFNPGPLPPSFICRSSQARASVEWQADFYASCLLMPRKLVFAAWDEMFPDRKQRVIQPEISISHPFVEVKPLKLYFGGRLLCIESVDETLDRIAKPLAEKFLVSAIAMRIRLEGLGLLLREVPLQQLLY